MTLDYLGPEIRLLVRNEPSGTGGPSPATGAAGFGLIGMRERIALIGGTLTAGRDAAAGWSVTAKVPADGGSGQ